MMVMVFFMVNHGWDDDGYWFVINQVLVVFNGQRVNKPKSMMLVISTINRSGF